MKKYSSRKDFLEPVEKWWLALNPWKRRFIRLILSMILSFVVFIGNLFFLAEYDKHAVIYMVQFTLGSTVFYVSSLLLTAVSRSRRDLEVKNKELQKLSLRDSLTGLHNRRYMEIQVEQLQIQAKRLGFSTSVAMIDLDDLKSVNDTYGHAAGDEFLKMAATRMRTVTRECDIVARIGGDEFIIILPHLKEDPSKCEERLHRIMDEFVFTCVISSSLIVDIPTGASVGFSLATDHDINKAIGLADDAMYERKKEKKRKKEEAEKELSRRKEIETR